jgi:hypothetical protein
MAEILELGDGTFIGATEAATRVRGGGLGSGAWLAQITGTDPKWTVARDFCVKDAEGLSHSRKSGVITFEVPGPGLYQYKGFCVSSTRERSGYVEISGDGQVREVTKAYAVREAGRLQEARRRAWGEYEFSPSDAAGPGSMALYSCLPNGSLPRTLLAVFPAGGLAALREALDKAEGGDRG